MMGIFGPDTRVIGGLVYEKQHEFYSESEAETWAHAYENKGYDAKVIPNASRRTFEVWVVLGKDPRVKEGMSNGEKNPLG